jgi:hypothetical protein
MQGGGSYYAASQGFDPYVGGQQHQGQHQGQQPGYYGSGDMDGQQGTAADPRAMARGEAGSTAQRGGGQHQQHQMGGFGQHLVCVSGLQGRTKYKMGDCKLRVAGVGMTASRQVGLVVAIAGVAGDRWCRGVASKEVEAEAENPNGVSAIYKYQMTMPDGGQHLAREPVGR